MKNLKISYRPEIDGLRAIAVLSVIIYHTHLNLFGFGVVWRISRVDVFL